MFRPNLYLLVCKLGFSPFLHLALHFQPHFILATPTAPLEKRGQGSRAGSIKLQFSIERSYTVHIVKLQKKYRLTKERLYSERISQGRKCWWRDYCRGEGLLQQEECCGIRLTSTSRTRQNHFLLKVYLFQGESKQGAGKRESISSRLSAKPGAGLRAPAHDCEIMTPRS